ncbi:hypothetical protein [Nannocystis radixulma]|uniref:Lipoprotein n=1 Tax=Nannocystis radixulma TaxID=2995305 RepID=A0ABT5AYH3_9BACT|nr:hypothetical protein [Nannocystis radixulma]MDC0666886.1 hypothetical protein [Nannocystis radixulma]
MLQRTPPARGAFRRLRCLLVPCLLSACDACDPQLPPAVASSRYIEFHTWVYPDGLVDGAVVCMDDKLAEMDRFVEFVADALELPPPTTPIHYVHTPQALVSEDTWVCPANAGGCFDPDGRGDQKVVYSTHLDLMHELVHAVETPALGRSHPVFEEGMANYLSTDWSSADILPEFPTTLKAGIGPGRHPGGAVSMHFVGALLARGTMSQYVDLRRRVGHDDGLAELAAAYEHVFGGSFAQFLDDASATPVIGLGADPLCAGPPTIPWESPGPLDVTLPWACGDGRTFGIGKAFQTAFSLDVQREGSARMTVTSAGDGSEPEALLDACARGGEGGFNAFLAGGGRPAPGVLIPGRHVLSVLMSSDPAATGELSLVIE